METKPTVKLVGEDGNVFAIIARVSRAIKNAGTPEKAKEFTARAFRSGSYQEVLSLVQEYVDVE